MRGQRITDLPVVRFGGLEAVLDGDGRDVGMEGAQDRPLEEARGLLDEATLITAVRDLEDLGGERFWVSYSSSYFWESSYSYSSYSFVLTISFSRPVQFMI